MTARTTVDRMQGTMDLTANCGWDAPVLDIMSLSASQAKGSSKHF